MTAAVAMEAQPQLAGPRLWICGVLIALANFVAILDISVANVSVPNIAGALGISVTQGTWVITSYAVAEAIMVPLTGWLAARFGPVRVFVLAFLGFGLASLACGCAPSFGLLVLCRVVQGLCGGPLMPLSQTLLMTIFPKRLHPAALAIWAITTIIAPILGPVTGGTLCDLFGWGSIFTVNVPICLLAAFLIWRMLPVDDARGDKARMDFVGLGLLIVWVAALQIMLDLGRAHDWFQSPLIVTLGVIAAVGFVYFVIWELTDRHPVVNLNVFRHRGYSVGMVALAMTVGAFFATNVIIPLWLQTIMGYPAVWAGYAASIRGVSALIAAPIAARLMTRMDPRWLISAGVLWLALLTFLFAFSTTDMNFGHIELLMFLSGFGFPLFFLPLIAMTLADVDAKETASASGLQNFIRTMATAVAISVSTTLWENGGHTGEIQVQGAIDAGPNSAMKAEMMAARLHGTDTTHMAMVMEKLVQKQAVMLATNGVFVACALLYLLCAAAVWLVPKPQGQLKGPMAH